jgi:hypothetical protein
VADKITRFEDYVNKEGRQDHAGPHREGESDSFGKRADGQAEESANVEGRHDAAPQKSPEKPEQGLTQEILSIEIEDPVQFFTEEERQEYYAQMRRKETEDRIKRRTEEERAAIRREQEKERSESAGESAGGENRRHELTGSRRDAAGSSSKRSESDESARKPESKRKTGDGRKDDDSPARKQESKRRTGDDSKGDNSPAREAGQDRERRSKDDRRDSERAPEDKRRRPDPRAYDEYRDNEYDEGFDDDEYIDDDETSGVNMDLVVRIASVITGILILAFIGIAVKVKVFDRYFTPDPDETETVVVSLPAGYTAQDDTVVVSGASSLNLRTVPSTGSDEYIAMAVDEGTELKRIAVSEDGKWALVEYNGQQLYVSMKYLKVK